MLWVILNVVQRTMKMFWLCMPMQLTRAGWHSLSDGHKTF